MVTQCPTKSAYLPVESMHEYPTHTRQPPLEENANGSVMHRMLPAAQNGGAHPSGMPFSTQRMGLSKGQNSEEPCCYLGLLHANSDHDTTLDSG